MFPLENKIIKPLFSENYNPIKDQSTLETMEFNSNSK